MNNFRMNWSDYKNNRYVFNGIYYPVVDYPLNKKNDRLEILFLLNIHRGRYVTNDDILEYLYYYTDPDEWSDWQMASLRVSIHKLNTSLPYGLKIENAYGYGYRLLIEKDECNDDK